jgi:hypothetical protein
LLNCRSIVLVGVGFQHFKVGSSGIRIGVLAQDSFNALAELVELFLQDFILGVVGFGSHVANQFIELVEREVKHRPLPGWRHGSQAARQGLVGESAGDDQVAFTLVQLQRNGFICLDGDSLWLRNDWPE